MYNSLCNLALKFGSSYIWAIAYSPIVVDPIKEDHQNYGLKGVLQQNISFEQVKFESTCPLSKRDKKNYVYPCVKHYKCVLL